MYPHLTWAFPRWQLLSTVQPRDSAATWARMGWSGSPRRCGV